MLLRLVSVRESLSDRSTRVGAIHAIVMKENGVGILVGILYSLGSAVVSRGKAVPGESSNNLDKKASVSSRCREARINWATQGR